MVTPNDPTLVVSPKPCQSALTRKKLVIYDCRINKAVSLYKDVNEPYDQHLYFVSSAICFN